MMTGGMQERKSLIIVKKIERLVLSSLQVRTNEMKEVTIVDVVDLI